MYGGAAYRLVRSRHMMGARASVRLYHGSRSRSCSRGLSTVASLGQWTLARWVIGIALDGRSPGLPGCRTAAPSQEHSSGAGLYLPALPFSAAISPLPTAQGAANAANLTASSTLTVQPQTRPNLLHTPHRPLYTPP